MLGYVFASAVFFLLFLLWAALNFVAAVFYGRVDATKTFGYLDLFTVDEKDLTAMGVRARRSVIVGIAGMSAVLLVSLAAAPYVLHR